MYFKAGSLIFQKGDPAGGMGAGSLDAATREGRGVEPATPQPVSHRHPVSHPRRHVVRGPETHRAQAYTKRGGGNEKGNSRGVVERHTSSMR
jgi:hypothetical protein